jgi:hypothetical protein
MVLPIPEGYIRGPSPEDIKRLLDHCGLSLTARKATPANLGLTPEMALAQALGWRRVTNPKKMVAADRSHNARCPMAQGGTKCICAELGGYV